MLIIRLLNAPVESEECLEAVRRACFGLRELELESRQLLIECPVELAHTWSSVPMIVVTVDVCFPAEGIVEETRRKLARKIASEMKRTKNGRHQYVKVVVRNFRPEEVVVHRAPAKK